VEFAVGLAQLGEAAKAKASGAAGFFQSQAPADILVGKERQVDFQLLFEILIESAPRQ
jgi:hypothetical protein